LFITYKYDRYISVVFNIVLYIFTLYIFPAKYSPTGLAPYPAPIIKGGVEYDIAPAVKVVDDNTAPFK
jgi:hypothetical protein